MKPIFKYSLKLFVIMSLGMFLATLIGDYIFGDEIKLSAILFKSFTFGLFMTIFFTIAQRYGIKEAGVTNITDENLKPQYECEIVTSLSTDQITSKLNTTHEFKDVVNKGNKIQLRARWSLQSWGEKISIETIKNENNLYTYLIKSKPIVWTTIADYGKNRKNVNKVINIIYA